ncbi:enolase C-terminal domain-like protein [Caulobacter sp. KR2-114]|uniref:enolase C-terminal domain-like protein n=1 Tax=Caulobacter sp. KR2-114 TaxID=3400912 RepID=UPI003C07DF6A
MSRPAPIALSIETRRWAMAEPFAISRETKTETESLVVTLTDAAGRRGRGEGYGVTYAGETLAGMAAQIEAAWPAIAAGADREALLEQLPPGGARCALDAALWDLEAKQTGRSVFDLAGVAAPGPVDSAYTIGIRPPEAYEAAARRRAGFKVLKIKVDAADPLAAIAAARRGAPDPAFIVDPNQAWSVETLKALAPRLAGLGVVLLEQPIPVGHEADLDGYACPVRLCADELINHAADLPRARGRFDVVNIKLDKAGGLTGALRLAKAARAEGFGLMVGCMGGSSLAMAPALVLAQQCDFVDLDGPLLLAHDWPDGLTYRDGRVAPADPAFWG